MPRASTLTLLALSATLGAGCAYISDDDEKWRLDPDGDGVALGDDCDDENADLAATVTWYTDADGDGFGAPGTEESGCEAPAGSADNGEDCDDNDSSVFPEAPDEWYDGVDSNCLGDDDFDQDGDGYTVETDCDDQDASRAPDESVEEVYFNGVDDNCNNVDQDGDQDGDGFWAHDYVERVNAAGVPPMPIPDGMAGDCWDDGSAVPDAQQVISGFPALTAPDVNPGATETWYDGADQDCGGVDANADGVLDDFDRDSDGHASVEHPDGTGAVGTDCVDTDPSINPGMTETWYDGVDSDCGGDDDYDADGDLYQSGDHGGDDCDDIDAAVNPGAFDFWYDGVDQDCGGEDDYDADSDGDQSADWGGFDCDDADPAISSLAAESWYDGVDQDCSGGSDFDADGDGYDSSAELAGGGDCDDANSAANPGMVEICDNGFDDDCDGSGVASAGACWLEGTVAQVDGDILVRGGSSGDNLGSVVAFGEDLDVDGTDDWAFGVPNETVGTSSSVGAAYFDTVQVVGTGFGAGAVTAMGGAVFGTEPSDQLGAAIAMGDFDGDGLGDLYVTAPGANAGAGAAFALMGPLGSTSYVAFNDYDAGVFGAAGSGELVGKRIVNVGDHDSDGADDIAVGNDNQEVILVSGLTGSSGLASAYPRLTDTAPSTVFGYQLDGAGDLDGDGIQDLVVTAPTTSSSGGAFGAGAAYVFHGPLTASATAGDAVGFLGSSTNDYVGYSVSTGGDVDGDGLDDLLIGSTSGTTGGSLYDGGAYLVHGPASAGGALVSVADGSYGSPASNSNCGTSVSSSADVDGNGTADVLVSCTNEAVAGISSAGAVYLVYDAPSAAVDLGSAAFARIVGSASGDLLGRAYGVPDVDGDGYDEVLIGGPAVDARGTNDGRVSLFYGGSW